MLLFECLTGHAPYPRDIEVGVLWAHVEDPPPTVTEERPDLPTEVDDVVATAMAKDPEERTATAGDVAAGFRSALRIEAPSGGGVVAAESSALVVGTPPERGARRGGRGCPRRAGRRGGGAPVRRR